MAEITTVVLAFETGNNCSNLFHMTSSITNRVILSSPRKYKIKVNHIDTNVFTLCFLMYNAAYFNLAGVIMKFDLESIKQNYNQSKGRREAAKWLFGIATFGLGGLYLWATTTVIKDGEIGLRSNARGEMILLPPGRHSNFPWESYPCKPQSLSKDNIQLDRYKIITVSTGQVAQTSNHGKLEILTEGQYLITDPSHVFHGFVSTKQETKKLHAVVASTSDNVGLTLQADVRYQIEQPEMALGCIHDIEASIIERAEMTIAKIVGSHKLADFAPTATNVASTIAEGDEPAHGLTKILAEIMKTLTANLNEIGISLLSLGVTSWRINDESLAHQLAQGAVIQSQTASEMLTAQRDADILAIKSQAEANAIKTRANADAEAIELTGEAHKKVAESFRDNPMALQVYQAAQAAQLVKYANNPHLFLTTGGGHSQAPVVTLPVEHQRQVTAK